MDLSTLTQSIPISSLDVFTLGPIIILMGLLFYFSNKEIQKSLEQSKIAQELLSEDREKLRQELRDARSARLQELAKAAEFGRLSQGIFHDLMTPLTSIILHTEKLKDTDLTPEHVEKAVEASRRMASYIKDMRATLVREEIERMCVLKDELEAVIRFLRYQAREQSIQISVDADDTRWYGSPTKIRQIFSNILSNSLDSFLPVTDGRKKMVTVLIKKSIVTISDNGCGISEKNLEKVFEPFFTTKPHDKGTGIGLTTVKTIVEKNIQGTISITSTPEVGTTIVITFPPSNTSPDAFPQPQHIVPSL